MKIAIFGSCVSRDSCEHMANDDQVVTYVARHSMVSLLHPYGAEKIDTSNLDSPFQRRMVTNELQGRGSALLVQKAQEIDLVLIDLVDERLGFWITPDGRTMTRSAEVRRCHGDDQAEHDDARLVPFGTDEHFARWGEGFKVLVRDLDQHDLLRKTVFIDIEWATTLEGSTIPRWEATAPVWRTLRRSKRGLKVLLKSLSGRTATKSIIDKIRNLPPTDAEMYEQRANAANSNYIRYRDLASKLIPNRVKRNSGDVRISIDHKWGPQPFHYRDEDYRSIVGSIRDIAVKLDV